MMVESYNYKARERQFAEDLSSLKGERLVAARAQVVVPEINVVYLVFERGAVAIQCDIGGELLCMVRLPFEEVPACGSIGENVFVVELAVTKSFLGRKIVQTRTIGEAWNGHGVEIGLEGIATASLVVTSVECAENGTEVHDALRFAVPQYTLEIERGDDDV